MCEVVEENANIQFDVSGHSVMSKCWVNQQFRRVELGRFFFVSRRPVGIFFANHIVCCVGACVYL